MRASEAGRRRTREPEGDGEGGVARVLAALCRARRWALAATGIDRSTTADHDDSANRRRRETRDPLPDRPAGVGAPTSTSAAATRCCCRAAGRQSRDGPRTLIRSFDRLVAISIVPDREPESLAAPIADYATNTAEGLRGIPRRPRGGREPPGRARVRRDRGVRSRPLAGSGRSASFGVRPAARERRHDHGRARGEHEAGGAGVGADRAPRDRDDPNTPTDALTRTPRAPRID